MNSKDIKSSKELKNEVLRELNQLNSDIDKIQGRLTPGQIIDDALFHPVGRNPRAVFDHLKANPVGTAFLGIGTLLLMENENHVTYEGEIRKRSGSVIENTRYQATLLKGTVSNINGKVSDRISGVNGKIHGAVDMAKSRVTGLKDKISGMKPEFSSDATGADTLNEGGELGASSIDQIKDTVTEKFDSFTAGFDDVKNTVTEKVDTFAGDVKETAFNQVNTVKNIDPITLAAIGAGLGALTGIALPVSEKEQSLIDQKAAGTLNTIGSEFQDSLNQSVKILKDEFLGKFGNFDVNLFGKKNETYRGDSPQI